MNSRGQSPFWSLKYPFRIRRTLKHISDYFIQTQAPWEQGFHFSGKKFSFGKWNDPEICCVNRNFVIIPDQKENGMFTVYVT